MSQVALDASGNLYIADAGDNQVRVVYAGGTVPGLANFSSWCDSRAWQYLRAGRQRGHSSYIIWGQRGWNSHPATDQCCCRRFQRHLYAV